ncbi:mitochondrial transcription factor A [Xylocopa sonorina]|uniref:mitochondrial transcription factor A n=1 Tax=Xylocopa sonorina TaxID=1818115 RepID=UPI00403B2157
MAGYGSFMFFVHSKNLLSTRCNLLSCCRNASKLTLKSIRNTVFPLKPKRPETVFLLYLKHIRPKVIKENPNIKSTEIVRKASKEWAELDPIEKENFQRQYNRNYEVYVKELKEYNNSITDEQKQLWEEKKKEYIASNNQANNKQKSEVFGKPKKPLSAFLSYMATKKSERDPDTPFMHWLKSTTISWNALSEAEKEPYVTQAAQSMIKYRKDLDEWEMKMMRLGHSDIVRHKTLMKYKDVKGVQ